MYTKKVVIHWLTWLLFSCIWMASTIKKWQMKAYSEQSKHNFGRIFSLYYYPLSGRIFNAWYFCRTYILLNIKYTGPAAHYLNRWTLRNRFEPGKKLCFRTSKIFSSRPLATTGRCPAAMTCLSSFEPILGSRLRAEILDSQFLPLFKTLSMALWYNLWFG